jgi:peroxin-2
MKRYRSIPDRLLKLRLLPSTKSQAHHLLSYEFLNRQLTWTSLTEFLLFILPLILPSYRRLRRRLIQATKSEATEQGALSTLPDRFCAVCFSQGREGRLITNPYCGECGHAYCYTCLLGEVAGEEGDGWHCLRCGMVIKHVKRWQEVILDELPCLENKDEVGQQEAVRGEGSLAEEISIEEVVTPETEETEEEAGEQDSEEGENLFG